MSTLGGWLEDQGFTVDDENVPYGRESTWRGVSYILVHHTVSDCDGSESSIADYIKHGGSGTYPPLAQIMLGHSGKVWMTCKERSGQPDPGRASHAGSGSGYGIPKDSMNEYSLGIECQCDGSHPIATHSTQYATLIRLLAALCRRYDVPVEHVIGHKEWSSTGKVDPRDDMDDIRADVAAELDQPSSGGPYVTEHVYRSKCGFGEPTNGDSDSDTVKELQERLNRISLDGGQTLPVTGRYDAETDEEVRLWQEQICHDPPDPVNRSFLGPKQFAYMFPDSTYILHDDGDPAIASEQPQPPDPPDPEEPDQPVGIVVGYGKWDWYSGKKSGPVTIKPGAGWTDLPGLVQPPSNLTDGDPRDHHYIYTRWELTPESTAGRKAELRFVRSNGDETAYDHRLFDPGVSKSYPFPSYHTEAGSGLGGKWQAKITGGTDPATITTHYAKTEIEWQEEPAESLSVSAMDADGVSVSVGVSGRAAHAADPEWVGQLAIRLLAAVRASRGDRDAA